MNENILLLKNEFLLLKLSSKIECVSIIFIKNQVFFCINVQNVVLNHMWNSHSVEVFPILFINLHSKKYIFLNLLIEQM